MNVIPAPYRILALVLLLLAGIAFGYVQGISRESDRRDAQNLKQVRVEIKAASKESDRREAVGAAREVVREKIRVVYQTIREEVQNNVEKNAGAYAACGLDSDGLRLWNAANSGGAAPLPAQPDSALPGAAASAIGEAGGSIAEPSRRDGAGSPVPRSAQEAGGM